MTDFQPGSNPHHAHSPRRAQALDLAAATWRSFEVLDAGSGLPADHITVQGVRAAYTSPTNIAAYLWSTLAAGAVGVITPAETARRAAQTLAALERLERHAPSGMFFNWYHPASGETLTTWPQGGRIYPFLSSVDNGWLAAALWMAAHHLPALRPQAAALLRGMDFAFFLNPASGLLAGGYWPQRPPRGSLPSGFTAYDFGSLNTEPRIASYIGIALGSLPPQHYFRMARAAAYDNGRKRPRMGGEMRAYLGVDVYEGHYRCAGVGIVPSWEGSMFEALMPALFVPEAQWGPASWGVNHPLYVQAHIRCGLEESGLGCWGFSPCATPGGGYDVRSVPALAMNAARRRSRPGSVVTPHAVFLALPFAPDEAWRNLDALRANFALDGPWGLWDAVDARSGQVAEVVLALDQGMIMAALCNDLCGGYMQSAFRQGPFEQAVRPLLAMETFSAGLCAPARRRTALALPALGS